MNKREISLKKINYAFLKFITIIFTVVCTHLFLQVNVQAAFDAKYYHIKDGGTWDGSTYHLPDGSLAVNCFFCDGTYTYFLTHTGEPMKNRLTYHPDGEHVIYFDENGHETFDSFAMVKQSISGEAVDDMCYFNTFGYMYVNTQTYDVSGVNLYYINPYGVVERNGWFTYPDGGTGFAYSDGRLCTSQFMKSEIGQIFYLQANGYVKKGEMSDGTYFFTFDESDGHLVVSTAPDAFFANIGQSAGAQSTGSVVTPFSGLADDTCSYRIPAMVTLNNGTIVAAADARWNAQGDGGGSDTICATSTDNGATFTRRFANYFGDNGDFYNPNSASFIDPALATDGQTVYMLVDLLPSGYAFWGAQNYIAYEGKGFDEQGRLLLKKRFDNAYNYYLDQGSIYYFNGNKVEGFSVDGLFNVRNSEEASNLFFVNEAPFSVYPTAYLYLTKSVDGGQTWSAPTLINQKKYDEQGYSVGCGRGTILSDGTIIFPCYSTARGHQYASFIYSRDGGKTFTRTKDATEYSHNSSEASIVEIGPGLVRMFFRDETTTIYYVDYISLNGGPWSKTGAGSLAGITKTSECQLNAIKYDDHTILLSTGASGNSERNSGVILTIHVDDGGHMGVSHIYNVNGNSYYGYSCLTRLKDGSVGLLYEDMTEPNKFRILYKRIMAKDLGL